MNVGGYRNYIKRLGIPDMLNAGEVDSAWVQAARDLEEDNESIGNYTIYATPSWGERENESAPDKRRKEQKNIKGDGGVAIIRTVAAGNISSIQKIDDRLSCIRIRTEEHGGSLHD